MGIEAAELSVADRAVDAGSRQLTDPSLYINFQLSWLAFNERVMEEAEDQALPLLERAKFHAIVTTNSDEFFMVRVAGLRQAYESGAGPIGDDGLTSAEVLTEINQRSQALGERQLKCFQDAVLPELPASTSTFSTTGSSMLNSGPP